MDKGRTRTAGSFRHCWIAVFGVLLLTTVSRADNGAGRDTFFDQFVVAGGGIVYYVLIPMSLLAVCRIIELFFLIRRKRLLPGHVPREIATAVHQSGFGSLSGRLAERHDFVSRAFCRAVTQAGSAASDRAYLEDLAAEALHDEATKLLRKVELCNIIGNVAPMVGLFGTVYGMIQAFGILEIAGGQPRPDELAGKISVALVTTFWGLLIAIPSLTIYGAFRTRIETLVSEAAVQIETLLRHQRPTAPGPQAPNASIASTMSSRLGDRQEASRKRREPPARH